MINFEGFRDCIGKSLKLVKQSLVNDVDHGVDSLVRRVKTEVSNIICLGIMT